MPVHGLSRGGGLRLGEMEQVALLSWGDSRAIANLMADHNGQFPFCQSCGNWARSSRGQTWCGNCEKANLCLIKLPTATKIWLDCLAAMNLAIHPSTKKIEVERPVDNLARPSKAPMQEADGPVDTTGKKGKGDDTQARGA